MVLFGDLQVSEATVGKNKCLINPSLDRNIHISFSQFTQWWVVVPTSVPFPGPVKCNSDDVISSELASLAHVELDEACLVQPLPQSLFHLEVMVDVEDHWVVVLVVVVVRVLHVVWGHEAVHAHLRHNTHTHIRMKLILCL